MKKDIKNFVFQELREYLLRRGFLSRCADQIFNWVYKRRLEDFRLMTNISKRDRAALEKEFYFSALKLLKKEVSHDGTKKFLFGLADGYSIETVLIPEGRRFTLCISTQVGCKFRCEFCLSGRPGFRRNLTICEIINQYLGVLDLIRPKKITNVVFMGIGEPLDNFSNTIGAIKIFLHRQAIHLGKRKICISTCGLPPRIEELNRLNLGVRLSVSLHSADDGIRSKIMPVNKKYPLTELLGAVRSFSKQQLLPVTLEYVLLKGLNTGPSAAVKLKKRLAGINYKLNIIPYNRVSSVYQPPSQEEVSRFISELKKRKVFFTLRKPRGQDINAACGQLRAQTP
ncbi:MAG: 23S rRNA (adenine(2503)-C(2))-methyltransferase RlmN [Candidatus Omnitrophota bacterium]|nr:MAG: 23S rRNA (adenine(2503)-C(2))-methyltransferase RlmN [Candidatus Omnitrophota bacterium]